MTWKQYLIQTIENTDGWLELILKELSLSKEEFFEECERQEIDEDLMNDITSGY